MKTWTPKHSGVRVEYNIYKVLEENRGDLVSEAAEVSTFMFSKIRESLFRKDM